MIVVRAVWHDSACDVLHRLIPVPIHCTSPSPEWGVIHQPGAAPRVCGVVGVFSPERAISGAVNPVDCGRGHLMQAVEFVGRDPARRSLPVLHVPAARTGA